MIGKEKILFVPLWKISETVQGLATADNKHYLSKEETANGGYRIIDQRKILNDDELKKIQQDDNLRIKIIKQGIPKKMFHGRTIIPYDKGGSSDIESGRLSNYFAPTQFFIDWSEENISRMTTMTISERDKFYGKPTSTNNKIASRFQNIKYYFKQGLTFSITGLYAPTYRINSGSVFDVKGSCIFLTSEYKKMFSTEYVLGILCSKFCRYVQKNFIHNTVDSQVDDIKLNPIPIIAKSLQEKIENEVKNIIKKQKKDLTYNYQNFEQIKIDKLIYEIFGLNDETIEEVEDWYVRKYPKLSSQYEVLDNNSQ